MKWLTLEMIKKQLRIPQSHTAEDDMLILYGESAEETILEWCNRTYEDFVEKYGSLPKNIVHASLMLVDVSYQHRSPSSAQNLSIVPYGNIDVLIKPYMIL